MSELQQKILEFLKTHKDCVISTVSPENTPEAATVGFSENDDLTLTIGTSRDSRKFANIANNPRVAVVVGFSGNITVQYEGVARELADPELSARLAAHFIKVPEAQKYNDPSQTYLTITPTWVRYTNYANNPDIEELEEFA
jgi:general stress protein 26